MKEERVGRGGLILSGVGESVGGRISERIERVVEEVERLYPDRSSRSRVVEGLLLGHALGKVKLGKEELSALEFLGRKYIEDSGGGGRVDILGWLGEALGRNRESYEDLLSRMEEYRVEEIGHWKRLLEVGDGQA